MSTFTDLLAHETLQGNVGAATETHLLDAHKAAIAQTRKEERELLQKAHDEIASDYGVHPKTIQEIRNRRSWKWL